MSKSPRGLSQLACCAARDFFRRLGFGGLHKRPTLLNAARRNRNKPKRCRRYRDIATPTMQRYTSRTHTHRHTRYAVTHILRRALHNDSAHARQHFLFPRRKGKTRLWPIDSSGSSFSVQNRGFFGSRERERERKKALVRRPPVQETETGSSKALRCHCSEWAAGVRDARQD